MTSDKNYNCIKDVERGPIEQVPYRKRYTNGNQINTETSSLHREHVSYMNQERKYSSYSEIED